MISEKAIKELDEILREDYGKELSKKELFEVGNTLISYFELLAKIYHRNKVEDKFMKGKEQKFDS